MQRCEAAVPVGAHDALLESARAVDDNRHAGRGVLPAPHGAPLSDAIAAEFDLGIIYAGGAAGVSGDANAHHWAP